MNGNVQTPENTVTKSGKNVSDMWKSTFRSSQCSFAPLQKSRQNHSSYVWTEALPGMVFVSAQELSGVEHSLRTCLQGGGVPQVCEVTCGGSPHLSCKRDQIKVRDDVDRRVTPPPRKQALKLTEGSWNITCRKIHKLAKASMYGEDGITHYSNNPAQWYNLRIWNSDKLKRVKTWSQFHYRQETRRILLTKCLCCD